MISIWGVKITYPNGEKFPVQPKSPNFIIIDLSQKYLKTNKGVE